jgi:hypothetical protein
MTSIPVGRPIKIDGMAYAPTNEQGVVFLFGRLAPRLGFHVEAVQSGFPDCIARRRGQTCRIEFEYRASHYKNHPPTGADVIVCWDNDWASRPPRFRRLEIIELKSHAGAHRRVYAVGCDERVRGEYVDKHAFLNWSMPLQAQVGDLIIMYRTGPASEIRDLWKVTGPFFSQRGWRNQAYLRLVARLKKPLTYRELKSHRATSNLSVVRKRFQGKSDITDDWPTLHEEIIRRNPRAKAALAPFKVG